MAKKRRKDGGCRAGIPISAPGTGARSWPKIRCRPFCPDAAAASCRCLRLARQLEETQRMLSRMRRLAERDPLTCLYNRRAFFAKAAHLVKGKPCCLMVLDLDHFKRINDTYGHLTGDDILRQTGKAICAATRSHDIAGRVGGDEFAVVCGDVWTDETAMAIARRIVRRVNRMAGKSLSMPVNLSVGVARHRANHTLRETFRQADAALYQAKRSRRPNSCRLFAAEKGESGCRN